MYSRISYSSNKQILYVYRRVAKSAFNIAWPLKVNNSTRKMFEAYCLMHIRVVQKCKKKYICILILMLYWIIITIGLKHSLTKYFASESSINLYTLNILVNFNENRPCWEPYKDFINILFPIISLIVHTPVKSSWSIHESDMFEHVSNIVKHVSTMMTLTGAYLCTSATTASITASLSTCKRQRTNKVKSVADKIRQNFTSPLYPTVHFDGKVVKYLSGEAHDHEAVCLSGPTQLNPQSHSSLARQC